METVINILKPFLQHISPVVFVLVLCAGYFAKSYFTTPRLPTAVKTLIVAIVFVGFWVLATHISGAFDRSALPDYLITFCFTTSCYELILKFVVDPLIKKLGNGI